VVLAEVATAAAAAAGAAAVLCLALLLFPVGLLGGCTAAWTPEGKQWQKAGGIDFNCTTSDQRPSLLVCVQLACKQHAAACCIRHSSTRVQSGMHC
jgi:hypothetical protein